MKPSRSAASANSVTAPSAPDPSPGKPGHWRRDVEASLVVFLVALPLSLGIAVASGAPVVAGIIAAVVGGIVAGLLGGAPLQVTGPAAGLTAVVSGLVAAHGWRVTCLITVLAGLIQIGLGLSRVARAALAISPAVVHGMLAGIGLTIVIGQLHVLMGDSAPSRALDGLRQLPGQMITAHQASTLLGLGTIALTLLWRRLPQRLPAWLTGIPAPLVSVAVLTGVSIPFTVERVELPGNVLTAMQLPELPSEHWMSVLLGVITVALVASVESTLSAVAVEKMHNGPRADLDRELIGQGAANTLSGLLGGLPVTGVIVRSATNVRAGAVTRASTVLHAVWVAVFAVLLASVARQIPLSVLAGLLVVIGLGLVDLAHLRTIARHGEAMVWLATLAGVLALSLLEGVLLGVTVALLYAARRSIFAPVEVTAPRPGSPAGGRSNSWRVGVAGTLTFISLPRLARQLARIPAGAPVRLELRVDYLDHAAAEHLLDWVDERRRAGGTVEIDELGAPVLSGIRDGARPPRGRVQNAGPPPSVAPWNHGVLDLPDDLQATEDGGSLLLDGIDDYTEQLAPRFREVLRELGSGQAPTTLFITCADSRVVPNLITNSGPGDLFTVRNIGNLVPARDASQAGDSTRAAVEYAITVLGVATIAVCGHSGCGAMRALLAAPGVAVAPDPGDRPTDGPALDGWLAQAAPSLTRFRAAGPAGNHGEVDRLGELNVVQQLAHLREHPLVEAGLVAGSLTLVGMFFDIGEAEVRVLDPATGRFGSRIGSGV
jgi:carbonic anhydrase